MNILDYISKTHVKTATVEFNNQSINFFYKELNGTESEIVTEKIGGVLAFVNKQRANENYTPEGEELKSLNAMRDWTLFYQLCDAEGNRLFDTIEQMRDSIPVKLLDLASKGIQKSITAEEAEKNSGNRTGYVGSSDSQTEKTPALKTSSTHTA